MTKEEKEGIKPSPLAACSQLHASGLRPLFLGRALSALRSIGFTLSKITPHSVGDHDPCHKNSQMREQVNRIEDSRTGNLSHLEKSRHNRAMCGNFVERWTGPSCAIQ
jgi:hypothetical protein